MIIRFERDTVRVIKKRRGVPSDENSCRISTSGKGYVSISNETTVMQSYIYSPRVALTMRRGVGGEKELAKGFSDSSKSGECQNDCPRLWSQNSFSRE